MHFQANNRAQQYNAPLGTDGRLVWVHHLVLAFVNRSSTRKQPNYEITGVPWWFSDGCLSPDALHAWAAFVTMCVCTIRLVDSAATGATPEGGWYHTISYHTMPYQHQGVAVHLPDWYGLRPAEQSDAVAVAEGVHSLPAD